MDLLELHLSEIYDAVDVIIITEATSTYTKQVKPPYFSLLQNKGFFQEYQAKIRLINVTFSQCKKCQFCSPSGGWACEYHTRDSISEGLYDAADDDIVIVADLDEVVSEDYLFALKSLRRVHLFAVV